MKLISGFSEEIAEQRQNLLKKTTQLVIVSAVTMFIGIGIVSAWAIVLVTVTDQFSFCQSGFLFFR